MTPDQLATAAQRQAFVIAAIREHTRRTGLWAHSGGNDKRDEMIREQRGFYGPADPGTFKPRLGTEK